MSRILIALLLLALPLLATAQNDLALAAPFGEIGSPISGVALGANETVTARLVNTGNTLPAATAFNVSYSVNAGPPVVEMVTLGAPLLSNSAFTYTFTTQADLSVPGTYTFTATASLPGDVNPTNDSLTNHMVTNTAPSVGGTLMRTGGVLVLSGHTGSVLRWERSRDDGLTWEVLSNTTPTMNYLGADHRELFRVVVANFEAPPAMSNVYDSAEP